MDRKIIHPSNIRKRTFALDGEKFIRHTRAMADLHVPTVSEIRAAAKERGLSIAALCRRADINQSAFYRWEKGKPMSYLVIQKLIDTIAAAPPKQGNGHG
jgi:predicted transcriptional regulator